MNFEIVPLQENADAILSSLHGELQVAVSDFETGAAAIQADQNQSPVQRSHTLDAAQRDAFTEFDRIGQILTVEIRDFSKRKRELQCVRPVSGDALHRYQEVRTVLRTLTSAKRKTLLQDALEENDDLLLQAVIDGPGYLSGLSADEHTAFSKQAHDSLHGAETFELEQAELLANGLLQQIEKARTHINSFEKESLANAV